MMALQSFSPWSIVSGVFLTLAILSAAAVGYSASLHATGPADGAVVGLMIVTSLVATWVCALLGTICGTVGVRKVQGHPRLAATALALNALICMLPLLWWLLLVLTKGYA